MLNKKLQAIASLITKDDIVLDTCTDHAYLAIYLKENKLCKNVYASDISKNALEVAKKNITQKNLDIETFLSDGLTNIPDYNINTVVIAGVGCDTALKIVDTKKSEIPRFIISSNNNHQELRTKMLEKNYYIAKEIVIDSHNKFYPIMLFTKKEQTETEYTLKYGKSNNQNYFEYLIEKEQSILDKIPKNRTDKILEHQKNINYLEQLIKRN